MSAENRLEELGLSLPPVPVPVASYVNCVRSGNHLHVSGGLPIDGDRRLVGKIPTDLAIEDGQEASRLVILNRLAVIRQEVGSLDRVARVVSLQGFVNAAPDFEDHPQVINGASDLLVDIFGERGKHSRITLGAASLPLNAAVEISLVVEIS
jgi:enamine deaminase RidA (YjgF/YER057c/UK114 family)